MKTGRNPPPIFHQRGVRGAARPPVEESVQNFWKEALQFEENFTPREFWDMLRERFDISAL